MKKILMMLAMVPMAALAKTSTPAGFTDNLDEAFAEAKASGKYIYACFSGSDWCGFCKKLDKEIFAKKEFLDGVTNDYVLVFIDNPRNKSLLSEHAKKANRELTSKYGIEGSPTALIFMPDGTKIAETGYRRGGPAPYVKNLMDVRKNGPNLKKLAEAEKTFLGPYKDRMVESEQKFRKEVLEATKGLRAKALQNIDGLIKELESAKLPEDAPEGLSQKRDKLLEELKEMKGMCALED